MINLKNKIIKHKAVTHPLFDCIEDGLLSIDAIRLLMSVHFPIVEPYSQYLINILSHLNQNEKLILLKNINDEFGRGELSGCHNILYEQILIKQNIIPLDTPENSLYVEILTNLSRSKDTLIGAMAISGLATENVTVPIFTKIYNGLVNHYGFKPEELLYFAIHMGIDEEHAFEIEDILNSIKERVNDEFFYEKLEYYSMLGLDLRLSVWESAISRFNTADKNILNVMSSASNKCNPK